jgi:hypothetical protein
VFLFVDYIWGFLAALTIVFIQFFYGKWISSFFFKRSLGSLQNIALGLSLSLIFNTLLLGSGKGIFVHLHLLAIPFALKDWRRFPWIALKQYIFFLLFAGGIFLFSNTANPIIDWDVQSSYLYQARHWLEVGGISREGLYHVYDTRPQMISVMWHWGLLWGNENTCQTLDLFFFLFLFLWVAKTFKWKQKKLFILFLLMFCPLILPEGTNYILSPSPFLRLVGVAGNDFIVFFLAIFLIEFSRYMPQLKFPWMTLSIVFLNTRWNALVLFLFLAIYFLWQQSFRKKAFLFLVATVVLASPWYLWTFQVHGNPFYPHNPGIFGGQPMNRPLWNFFQALTKDDALGVRGVHSLRSFWNYFVNIGPLGLLSFLAIFIKSTRNGIFLFFAFFGAGSALLMTSQSRFYFLPSFIFAVFLLNSPLPSFFEYLKKITVACLVVLSFVSLKKQILEAFYFFRDVRHGRDYLMENRVRLYPAARWLAKNSPQTDRVLWPMNPYYYCPNPVMRYDNAAYLLPDAILKDSYKSFRFLENLGLRWIVVARNFYDTSKEPGPQLIEEHLKQILYNDPSWTLVKTLEKTGLSPDTQIWKFTAKKSQKP